MSFFYAFSSLFRTLRGYAQTYRHKNSHSISRERAGLNEVYIDRVRVKANHLYGVEYERKSSTPVQRLNHIYMSAENSILFPDF